MMRTSPYDAESVELLHETSAGVATPPAAPAEKDAGGAVTPVAAPSVPADRLTLCECTDCGPQPCGAATEPDDVLCLGCRDGRARDEVTA